jgi:hypothetical protein
MILDDIRAIHADRAGLRRFGLLMGGILAIFGGVAAWKGLPWAGPVLVLAVLLAGCAWIAPGALRLVHKGWMALAAVLGAVMSAVILTLLFYLVITPLGPVMRLVGEDPMRRRFEPELPSYWIRRKSAGPARDYEKQF